MIVTNTNLAGAFILEPEIFEDERGYFAKAWSEKELSALGVEASFVEGNVSFNNRRGTLRGMHYQASPYGQAKLVRCTRGSIYDVGVDLRRDSSTFGKWLAIELTAGSGKMLYLPGDFGHGYVTLEDDTEVYYQVTQVYTPESSRGFRWNDPAFGIEWPRFDQLYLNQRDREYPDYAAKPLP